MRRHLTKTDSANGFANRFLWAAVRRSKEMPDGGNLFTVDWAPIQRRMVDLVASARRYGEMMRDPRAREIWHAVYSEFSSRATLALKAAGCRLREPAKMHL